MSDEIENNKTESTPGRGVLEVFSDEQMLRYSTGEELISRIVPNIYKGRSEAWGKECREGGGRLIHKH